LSEVKERAEAILRNSSDGIAVTYPDGIIRQNNPAFDQLFGYESGKADGRTLTEIAEPGQVEVLKEALSTVVSRGQSVRLELTACRRDHTSFYADLALAPIAGSNEDTWGIVCSVRDITERKRMENELRQALEKEKELN